MDVIYLLVGVVLVGFVLVDFGWTTLASSAGAGPMTRWLAPAMWKGAIALHRRRPSHRFLTVAAVVMMFALMVLWILLTILGWWLITLGGSDPIVTSSTGATADAVDRLYFTGYTIFTLGNGDFRPAGGVWQMVTVAMTGTGLVLITLTITYLVPIVSAASAQRQLSSFISSLGETPENIVVNAWTGEDFGVLNSHLTNLAPMLHDAAQAHLTYPILHYLHPADPDSATPNAICRMAMALELLDSAVQPAAQPPRLATEPCRQGVHLFLQTLRGAHITASERALPRPDLVELRAAGIPVVADDDYQTAGEHSHETRRLLSALLTHTGWDDPRKA